MKIEKRISMDTIPDHRDELRINHNKNDIVARWVFNVHGKKKIKTQLMHIYTQNTRLYIYFNCRENI